LPKNIDEENKKLKTYNSKDSLVVTHLITNLPGVRGSECAMDRLRIREKIPVIACTQVNTCTNSAKKTTVSR
jgi:hypothetical protein